MTPSSRRQVVIDAGRRRARLGRRQHLERPAGGVEEVAADVVGLHSSDPVTPYLSLRARLDGFSVTDLDGALYEHRTLMRMPGMRKTLFIVPLDLGAEMGAACSARYAAAEQRRLVSLIERQGLATDGEALVAEMAEAVVAALRRRGEAVAAELKEDVADLDLRFVFGEGKEWGGTVGMSSRLLFQLTAAGVVVRARPRGSWRSSQYRWALLDDWLPAPLSRPGPEEAARAIATRWLATYGPGTFHDLKWWTGWTVAQTRRALAAVGAVEVGLGGGEAGWALADDVEPGPDPIPWVALLPGLDPAVMGWKERSWFIDNESMALLFDRNGNAGPTVWAHGRVVGGWVQLEDGEVAYRLLEDVGVEAAHEVAAAAAELQGWLGDDRMTTRFPVPLQRELAG